jgi:hypothetical protein
MSGVAVVRYLLANATSSPRSPRCESSAARSRRARRCRRSASPKSADFRATRSPCSEPKRLITDRVQVTVHTGAYDVQEQLLELVRLACPNQHGTVNGVDVDSILPDLVGPDLYDTPSGLYEKSRDFIVKWRTA